MIASILAMLFYAVPAVADAIMRSRAMFADTIAEYYVEDDINGSILETRHSK